ncbi:MAG: hypothetical protein WKG07_33540 [Hymenobacter sp.]
MLLVAGPGSGAAQARATPSTAGVKATSKASRLITYLHYNDRLFRPGIYIAPSFSRFFIEQSASYLQTAQQG